MKAFVVVFLCSAICCTSQIDSSRFSLELNTGYSYLLGSRKNPYLNNSTKLDHFSNFVTIDLGIYYKSKSASKNAFGIGINEWTYTVKREYIDYGQYDKWGGTSIKYTTASTIYTVFRTQLATYFVRSLITNKKIKLRLKFGLAYFLPYKSAPKPLNYIQSETNYFPVMYGQPSTFTVKEINDVDIYKETGSASLLFSMPFSFIIRKNLAFSAEPNLCNASWNIDYLLNKSGPDIIGAGLFMGLKAGIIYAF